MFSVATVASEAAPIVRDTGGRFVKGQSGNPSGGAISARRRVATLQIELEAAVRESLGPDRVLRVVNKLFELAEGGHMGAIKLLMDKIVANASTAEETPESGRTVVFRIENATFGAPQQKAEPQTPIAVEIVDATFTDAAPTSVRQDQDGNQETS